MNSSPSRHQNNNERRHRCLCYFRHIIFIGERRSYFISCKRSMICFTISWLEFSRTDKNLPRLWLSWWWCSIPQLDSVQLESRSRRQRRIRKRKPFSRYERNKINQENIHSAQWKKTIHFYLYFNLYLPSIHLEPPNNNYKTSPSRLPVHFSTL